MGELTERIRALGHGLFLTACPRQAQGCGCRLEEGKGRSDHGHGVAFRGGTGFHGPADRAQARAYHSGPAGAQSASATVTTVPPPGGQMRSIALPCSSTILFAMGRPRPVHCPDPRRGRYASTYVEEIDLKTAELCRRCDERVRQASSPT